MHGRPRRGEARQQHHHCCRPGFALSHSTSKRSWQMLCGLDSKLSEGISSRLKLQACCYRSSIMA